MSGLSSLVRRRQASMTRTPGIRQDLGHPSPAGLPTGEGHDPTVVRVMLVVPDVEAGETVGERVVDVVEVGEVRGSDGDERTRKTLPGLRGRDGPLLERLEQHVLGAERELADLVDQEEAPVRLEELARFEHKRAHRVPDLLELPEVDVPGEMVRKHLGTALEPGEPESLAEVDVLGGDLRRVHGGRVEPGDVAPR